MALGHPEAPMGGGHVVNKDSWSDLLENAPSPLVLSFFFSGWQLS